ncbi:MAG: Rnf-Nqr domain containing protein [Pseudomonadota bacterium]
MKKKNFVTFFDGIWRNNPTFRMILGICSTLAVTNQLANTIAMSMGLIFVLTSSMVTISLMRKFTPPRIRLAINMIVIATYTMAVDIFLQAKFPVISSALGPYVGLIITNCIILGRAEAFAIHNNPILAFLDALGVGVGYAISLIIIAIIREAFGFGTILNIPVMGENWTNWNIMVLAPGAFFMLAGYIWFLRLITKCEKREGCR